MNLIFVNPGDTLYLVKTVYAPDPGMRSKYKGTVVEKYYRGPLVAEVVEITVAEKLPGVVVDSHGKTHWATALYPDLAAATKAKSKADVKHARMYAETVQYWDMKVSSAADNLGAAKSSPLYEILRNHPEISLEERDGRVFATLPKMMRAHCRAKGFKGEFDLLIPEWYDLLGDFDPRGEITQLVEIFQAEKAKTYINCGAHLF